MSKYRAELKRKDEYFLTRGNCRTRQSQTAEFPRFSAASEPKAPAAAAVVPRAAAPAARCGSAPAARMMGSVLLVFPFATKMFSAKQTTKNVTARYDVVLRVNVSDAPRGLNSPPKPPPPPPPPPMPRNAAPSERCSRMKTIRRTATDEFDGQQKRLHKRPPFREAAWQRIGASDGKPSRSPSRTGLDGQLSHRRQTALSAGTQRVPDPAGYGGAHGQRLIGAGAVLARGADHGRRSVRSSSGGRWPTSAAPAPC